LVGHVLAEQRRTDALAMASELTRAFGALAADAESITALKALRSAMESGMAARTTGDVLGSWLFPQGKCRYISLRSRILTRMTSPPLSRKPSR
jgi:hypothetical protein